MKRTQIRVRKREYLVTALVEKNPKHTAKKVFVIEDHCALSHTLISNFSTAFAQPSNAKVCQLPLSSSWDGSPDGSTGSSTLGISGHSPFSS